MNRGRPETPVSRYVIGPFDGLGWIKDPKGRKKGKRTPKYGQESAYLRDVGEEWRDRDSYVCS